MCSPLHPTARPTSPATALTPRSARCGQTLAPAGGTSTLDAATKKGCFSSWIRSSSRRLPSPVLPSRRTTCARPAVHWTNSPACGSRSVPLTQSGCAAASTRSPSARTDRELLCRSDISAPPDWWCVACLVTERDAAARQIVRRQLERHVVTDQHANAELRHLPRCVRQHRVPVLQ